MQFGRWWLALGLLGLSCVTHAQFKVAEPFDGTAVPSWTLTDSAYLTAPSIDATGSGWLRLTNATNGIKGGARYTAGSFSSNQPLVIEFNYVSWGGTGADGISVYLFDSTQTMSGAVVGGGLGYCGGAGGYLGIGLDEYGNFSSPNDTCGSSGGGPGRRPERLGIRGPVGAYNQFITSVPVTGGIDTPYVATRPAAKTVILTMIPATLGFNITAQFQSQTGQAFQTLFSNVNFPYAPPASLSVGFGSSTGGSNNIHEVRNLTVSVPDDLQLMMSGPAQIAPGNLISYTITLTNNGSQSIAAADAPTLVDTLPAAINNIAWSCSGAGGATCPASGTGNLNTSTMTLPVNGAVTYTVTGTVDPATTCNATVVNTGTANFGASAGYSDPNLSNNTAAVTTTVVCVPVTVVVNPATLTFGPQTLNLSSSALPITLTGSGGATVSAISVSGDYAQSNDCSVPLTGTASCTINVVFTPTAEGSRGGILTITSTAPTSPTTIALAGTGTSAVPTAFSFTALTGVDPGTVQVSNAITVAGANVAAPIAIVGGEYSINGGAFTAAAGMVSPGAQVRVQLTAAAGYGTAAQATLSIDGVSAPFSVTTRAAAPGALSFGAAAFSGSGTAASFPITVTRAGGTDGAVSVQVQDAAGDVLGTARFAAGASGAQTVAIKVANVAAGANVALRLVEFTGGATAGAITQASLSIAAAPLATVTVTSGGGALSPVLLVILALVVIATVVQRSGGLLSLVGVAFLIAVSAGIDSQVARAASGDLLDDSYVGVRVGDSVSLLTDGFVSAYLKARGADVNAGVARESASATLYVGYDLRPSISLELAWTYLGHTRATVDGITPVDVPRLLVAADEVTRGSGDVLSSGLRYRLPLYSGVGLDVRGGLYGWSTQSDVWIGAARQFQQRDRGVGFTVGGGPHVMVSRSLGIGLGVDYFASTRENRFVQTSALFDYHF